jgi:glutaredoxin 3
MSRVVMYTTTVCPFCMQAKRLLRERGIPWEEINVEDDPQVRMLMVQRAGGRRTVPQIFIDGVHVGGYVELQALADEGGLAHLP